MASGDSGIRRGDRIVRRGTVLIDAGSDCGDQHRLGGRAVDGRPVLGNSNDIAGRVGRGGWDRAHQQRRQSRRILWAVHHWFRAAGDRWLRGWIVNGWRDTGVGRVRGAGNQTDKIFAPDSVGLK